MPAPRAKGVSSIAYVVRNHGFRDRSLVSIPQTPRLYPYPRSLQVVPLRRVELTVYRCQHLQGLGFSHFPKGSHFSPTGDWDSSSLALVIGYRSWRPDVHCGYPILRLCHHAILPVSFRNPVGWLTYGVVRSPRPLCGQGTCSLTISRTL